MTETEWLGATFALLLMEHADSYRFDGEDNPTGDWRSVAARVACFERLGSDMPEGVREWVCEATAYLDEEQRLALSDPCLFDSFSPIYGAMKEAFAVAGPDLQQRLAAAQDAFHGADYYACEYLMIDQDENSLTYTGPIYVAESAAQCAIIRDIFGNPFRPVTFCPSWLTSTAVGVAQQMYDARDFAAMPILADALQDAGCEDEQVLAHCRGAGPHVRGCWVVDGVLSKG